ncbi:hypothetical protein [Spirillospora sp. NPDC047279]|uniref:hypothetical protein n=1 Tax=Spirillospora sp. NPDC047279 TaxID=3155478 RepID=UPI00340183E6
MTPAAVGAITVDPWDPGYATSLTAEALAELDATSAELDLSVELPAARWRPITPAAAPGGPVLVADGVRRIEARVWINGLDDGMPSPGIAASYAAGLVRCEPGTGGLARLTSVDVRRSIFSPSSQSNEIHTWAGSYASFRARDGSAEQLSLALQRQLTALEVEVATEYRAAIDEDELLIVDGPLRGRTQLPRTVGYIKAHHAGYLPDLQSDIVGALRPGQRTPVFLMGTSWRRYSWYLRLPTRSAAPWAGIARCEASTTLSQEAVTALADHATGAIQTLAGVDYKDPRAPQNLIPVGGLERLLRHRLGDAGVLYRALLAATADGASTASADGTPAGRPRSASDS